jgi:hypothetical protein
MRSDHPVIADSWRLPSSNPDTLHPIVVAVVLGPGEAGQPSPASCKAKAGRKTWLISTETPEMQADSVTFAVARFDHDFSVFVMLSPASTWDQATLLTFLDHPKVDARLR